jgi:hypothetical protein
LRPRKSRLHALGAQAGLSKRYDGRTTPGLRAAFVEVQSTIEQLDKAIADEYKIAPPAPPKGLAAPAIGQTSNSR